MSGLSFTPQCLGDARHRSREFPSSVNQLCDPIFIPAKAPPSQQEWGAAALLGKSPKFCQSFGWSIFLFSCFQYSWILIRSQLEEGVRESPPPRTSCLSGHCHASLSYYGSRHRGLCKFGSPCTTGALLNSHVSSSWLSKRSCASPGLGTLLACQGCQPPCRLEWLFLFRQLLSQDLILGKN